MARILPETSIIAQELTALSIIRFPDHVFQYLYADCVPVLCLTQHPPLIRPTTPKPIIVLRTWLYDIGALLKKHLIWTREYSVLYLRAILSFAKGIVKNFTFISRAGKIEHV